MVAPVLVLSLVQKLEFIIHSMAETGRDYTNA